MHKKPAIRREYVVYALVLFLSFYLVPRFLVEKIMIDGSSMEPSLYHENHILIEKISRYFSGPDRFDVVVFCKQTGETKRTYVKRVIGLPGETVQIKGETIWINGKPLEEHYGKDPIVFAGLAREPITLGEGEYFVLGDNRTISADSRNTKVGIVKKSDLDGVAFLRIYPLSSFGKIK